MSVKVAAIQASSNFADVSSNIAKFTLLVEEAAQNGAKIIVLPEAALTGYTSQDFKMNWKSKGRTLASQVAKQAVAKAFFFKTTFFITCSFRLWIPQIMRKERTAR